MAQTQNLQQAQSSVPTGNTPGLEYIDVDFSAGIYSDQYGSLRNVADGAATKNTYGCYCPPSGGLAPLPAPSTRTADTWTLTPAQIAGHAATRPGYSPAINDANNGYGRMFLLDALVHGPVAQSPNTGSDPSVDVPVALYGYAFNAAGSSAGTQYDYTTSFVRQTPAAIRASQVILLAGDTRPLVVGTGNLGVSTSATNSGHIPTVMGVVSNPEGQVAQNNTSEFFALPDPTSLAATTPYKNNLTASPNAVAAAFLILHQGRILVVGTDNLNNEWTGDSFYYHPEYIWTALYGHFNINYAALTGPLVLAEENPSGIGAWGSISANQLIIIKNAGGAVEISGSVDNPTVLRLPGIRSVGGLPNIATSVPGHNFRYPGIVYGTAQGIFMWAGLDNSEAISENLDPLFWLWDRNWPGATFGIDCYTSAGGNFYGMYGPFGRFAYAHPFLFAPNGYVCDFRSDAWWQIENPATTVHYTNWSTSARPHKVWGFKGYIDDTHTLAGQAFDLETGQQSYFYESHPFKPSRNRYIECREVLVSVVGRSGDTVTVTLVGVDNAGHSGSTQAETITLTTSGITMVRLSTALTGSWVQVQVQSTSNNIDAAPRVLALSVGYKPLGML